MFADQLVTQLVFLAVGCGCGVIVKMFHPGKAAMKLSNSVLSGALGYVVGYNLIHFVMGQPGIFAFSVGVVICSLAGAFLYGLIVGGTGKTE